MGSRRTKSIGTKVTPDEYDRIHALAGDQPVSEWVRAALLRAVDSSPAEPVVLAEVLALRTILLNLHFSVCNGTPLTAESMQRFIERADCEKQGLADARLASARRGER